MDITPRRLDALKPLFFLVALLSFSAAPAVVAAAAEKPNTDSKGVAIQGYDLVSYHADTPQQGSSQWQHSHQGTTYYFKDAANRDMFVANPEQYLPAYGGWCAWAMLDGELVDINPKRYKVIDGRTYLFYDRWFVNTLKKWNDLAAKRTEKALLEQADTKWQSLSE